MSFILDALKKSESDRQRQSGPSLFEVKVAPPRRKLPVWAVAIAVLLAINIVVVGWMLLRHPAERQAVPPVSAEAPAAAPPATRAIAQDAAPPRPGAPAASGSAGPEPAASAAAPQSTAATPPPSAAAVPAARAANPTQPPAATPPAGADQSTGEGTTGSDPSDYAPAVEPAAQGAGAAQGSGGELPLYQQVVTSANLPELHLDLHVFADRPRDRFAMINMHRVGEGDTLPDGVQVQTIRPDGVVLSYHGTRFLLPRN